MSGRRYVFLVAAAALLLAAAITTLNASIDPYGLRAMDAGEARLQALGHERSGEFSRKAFSVPRVMPRTIILGTSRANSGLDHRHGAFAAADAPVMNLALGAVQIEHMRLLLIHAHTLSGVRKAVIGLDMEAFLGGGRSDFDPAALAGNPDSQPLWLARLKVDFSRAALGASVGQVLDSDTAMPQASFEARVNALQGQRGVIWVTEINNFYSRLAELFPRGGAAGRWQADPRRRAAMASFRALLDYARQNDIELRMFVSPVHARYLEWYRHVGWWPLFQDWKRELVQAVAAARESRAPQPVFLLWDFSGFHPIAAEPVPRLGDLAARMKWYAESSHYSPALGSLVLDRIAGNRPVDADALPDGRIDRANIERHLSALALDAERYRATQAGEVANVREMVAYLRRIGRK
ncbi:MAG: hypothetical protein IT531_10180 [Burkholderiales bacterium]|nr:hypothetical protein [Burkholderiales bacterium]